MLLVGVPVLIKLNLDLGMDYVGISSSFMMAGGLIGGITAGILGTRLSIKNASLLLTIMGMAIIPVGLVFLFDIPAFTAYIIITASIALAVCVVQMLTIQFMAFVQTVVQTELIGKVMSLLVMFPFVANALGSFIYGVFFEQFEAVPWIIIFATVFASMMIAVYAHKHFGKFPLTIIKVNNISEAQCNQPATITAN
jgi:MFS family permease